MTNSFAVIFTNAMSPDRTVKRFGDIAFALLNFSVAEHGAPVGSVIIVSLTLKDGDYLAAYAIHKTVDLVDAAAPKAAFVIL